MANTFLENASKGKVNTNLKNLSQLPTNQFQAIPMPTVRKNVDMMINAPQPNSQDFTDRINAVNDFSNYYLSLPNHEEVGPMERYTLASILQPAFKEVSTDFIAKNLESYTESLLGTKLSQNWRKEFADQWNAYDIQGQIADMQRMIMFSSEDNPNDEYYEKKIEELRTQAALLTKDFDKRNKIAKWTIDSAGLANQRIRQLATSFELATLFGLVETAVNGVNSASNLLKFKQASGALNGTLVAGKNGTAYLVKPVYNALGEQTTRSQLAMAVGNQLYMNTDMMKVEMGDAFQTIRDYRDEEGNRVPKSIAKKWAENYGTLVLATEQSDEILDVIFSKYGISFGSIFTQIGLGRDWFKQAANLMKSNGFIQKVKNLLGLGVGVVSEAGQEGVQAAGQEALVQAAIMESNKKGYTNIDLGTIKDRSEKIWNALKTEFTDTSGSFIISKVFETTLGFTAYGAKKFIHPVSVKAKSDANAHFKPGGKIVNPFEIDTMGAVAEAPETKVDKDGKVIDEKLNAIFVDSPDVNGLQRGYSERDRKLIQWAREQGWEGIRVVEVPFSASQSAAERLANIINEDVAENFINESEQEGYTPNTDVDDIEDVDTSVNMEVPVVGTKDGDILVKNDASFEKVKEYFKNNSFTQSIITNDDGSISVRLSAGDSSVSVNVRVANEAEINGTDRKVVKVQTKADWATEMETPVSSNPFGKDEYLYSYEEYQTIKKLEDILAPQADKLKDNDIEMMGQSIRGAAKVMPIVSDVFGKPTSEILEKFVFTIDPESEKLKIRDNEGNLIDEAIAGIETTKKNGVQRYRITIGKNVRSDTLMHEIIHGLRKMATPEQLSGFAEAYGGTVGGMWLEDIKKVDGGYRLGDTVYKNEDDAKKAASKYEERFVDDFMRYLYSHEGFNDAQRTFFSKVQQFFEEFWDQMRSILSKELDASVVRAFDILFGKDTPVQERADFIEVAATEGIRTAVELANTGLEDIVERDMDNGLDEEGNTLWQGYDWDKGMSNNAVAAYESGEKPLSKWSKADILSALKKETSEEVADILGELPINVLRDAVLERTSWHHTSKYYNKTNFYSLKYLEGTTPEEAREFVDLYKWHKEDLKRAEREIEEIKKAEIVHTKDGDFKTSEGEFKSSLIASTLFFVTKNEKGGKEYHEIPFNGAKYFSAQEFGVSGKILWQKVTDEDLINQFESEPKIKAYRAMQILDGELYSPMATVVDGKRVNPVEFNQWYQADERPDLLYVKEKKTKTYVPINEMKEGVEYSKDTKSKGIAYYFYLDKDKNPVTGKSQTSLYARYNPYWHSSLSPLNDQFTSAYKRPNLVVVEVEIPVSDITSGYMAKYAKDPVGETAWKSGPVSEELASIGKPRKVFLSQYNKVIRVLPDSEVAQAIKTHLGDSGISIPANTVTPQLKAELEKIGVPITDDNSILPEYKVKEKRLIESPFIRETGTKSSFIYNYNANTSNVKIEPFHQKDSSILHQRMMDRNTQARIDADYEKVENALRADSFNFDSDGNHLAPNGKKSNLTYRQWVQVRTPAFMDWFGDWITDPENASKALDENGEPMVFYHGSKTHGIEIFDSSKSSSSLKVEGLIYATPDISDAQSYAGIGGEIYPFYLNIRNPLRLDVLDSDFDEAYKEWEYKLHFTNYVQNVGLSENITEEELVNASNEYAINHVNAIHKLLDNGESPNWDIDNRFYTHLEEYGWDGVIDPILNEYAVVNSNQVKSATDNSGEFSTENDSILYQKAYQLASKADYDGTVEITSDVKQAFEEAKKSIPEDSNWHNTLFQLKSVTANVKTSYKETNNVAYEVSMQPEVYEKFRNKEWKESDFEITSFEQARFINTNEERQKDWQNLYAEAMAAQWTTHHKDGTVSHEKIKFGKMLKTAESGKVAKIPCVDLSIGCQRIRTTLERVQNNVLPAETPIESCYGGTCFVNLDQAHKIYGTENVDTKDLVMTTPDEIRNWFKKIDKLVSETRIKDKDTGKVLQEAMTMREFLTSGNGFIRMGFRGDCAHSFPILDGYNTSLAETWLQCIKDYDVRNPKTGEYMKTIFITAGYAPTTEESYARLVPFKDMCEIHVSTSGWFSKNELMLRLAEFDVMNRLGLNVSLRVVTDKNHLSDSPFNNTNWLKDMIFNVLKVPQNQLLGTAYHNDKTGKHSEFDQDFENQCCLTGKCASCKVGCMSLIEKIEKGYKRENAPFGTQFVTDEDYLHKNGSKTGLILLQSIGTSPTTEIQPQDTDNYLVVDRTEQEKNESPMLYQLSDEERKKALESRKYEIETATAGGYWVRTEYIEEFAGEDWADRELKVRHWMQDSPDDYKELKDIARRVGDYQEFKEELHKKYEDNWFDEDESFYKRIYQLAQTRTAQEKDSEFIARNVMGDDNLLRTAKALKGYADLDFVPKPGRRSGGYYKIIGQLNRAKGVSNKVRSLSDGERGKERSTSEEIQAARELILKNPRAYRMAYEKAMLGEDRAGIIRGVEGKRFETEAVRQESNDLIMNYDLDTLDDRLEAELYSMQEEQLQAEKKANLAKAKKTDWKKTATQLEKKLAQANADLEKLNTEKLSRQQAQKQRDEAIAERNELRKQMTELQNQLSETKAERSQFKAQRDERRERVKELRGQLVEANRKVRTLSRILDAYERREAARNAKEVRDTTIAKIRKTVRIGKTTFSWHKDALDASYADAFAFINGIFAKVDRSDLYAKRKELEDLIDEMIEQQRDPKEIDAIDDELENIKEQIRGSEMRKVPEVLVPYLGSLQKADNRHSKWTLEELSNLLTVAQTIRQLAKDAFAPRFNAVQTERNNTVVNYVKEMSGIDISQMKADERRRLASTFPKDVLVRNVVLENLDWWRALAANPAGMTRFFDGEKEGVIFDFFTRQVRQQMQQEIERENERYQAGKEKIKELGLNSIELNKVIELEDGYTYKKANGEKVKLTVDNGIDVYIYMQNEDAKMKLLHVSGNGLTEKLAKRIIDALTPEQKAWGDWMMAELESHRQDSADIMYNVYNSIMGQVDRYFPLVSADRLYGGDDGLDIMSGAEGSTKRYVNKGHTKERVKVIYPLDLNATRTWVTAVKREEHFVAFAKWARDAQYYMDTKTPAGIRNVILQKYGPKNIEIFSDYVNSIANAKSYSDNVDKLLSTIIGRGAVSAVAGKLSVMFKQVATLPAVIGKTSFKNFLGSAFAPRVTLENFLKANEILFADYTSARDFVNKKDPIMANRKYGTELIGSLTNMGKKPIDAVASNVSEWIMRHSAGATDAYITKVVWLSCYMTTFENLKKQAQKKGVSFNVEAADKEAVFQASQLISETQNTSLDMDMSYIMRKAKSNPALKPFVLFSSTPMNLMTNLAYGIPRNIRNKNWKGIAHTIAYVTLAMFGNMAINGAFRRKKDEDDEEFAKRMWIEIGAETVSTLMPGYGGSFASMIRGSFTDTTGDISLISDITRVGRKGIKKVLNPKDNQAGWELFGELLYVGAESFGFPAGAAKNLVKSAYNLNPGYLINKTFAEIFEENFK